MVESLSFVFIWGIESSSRYRGYFLPDNWAKFLDGVENAALDAYFLGTGEPLIGWDLDLGWDVRPGSQTKHQDMSESIDEFGARYNELFSGTDPLITTYGDSFTFCAEVANNETWQYYLSKDIGEYVANFGVGGYGPDQALLKYTRSNPIFDSPKIVILGIHERDIGRILNRFRPFHHPNTGIKLGFKPRYISNGGTLEFMPQALEAPTIDRAILLGAIEDSMDSDSEYARKIQKRFPYSFQAVNFSLVIMIDKLNFVGIEVPILEIVPRPFWRSGEAVDLILMEILEFVVTAEKQGAFPVLLFIPHLTTKWSDGNAEEEYAYLIPRLRKFYEPDRARIIDVAEAEFDVRRFNVRPFLGHASPFGNRVIANHLKASISDLLSENRRNSQIGIRGKRHANGHDDL